MKQTDEPLRDAIRSLTPGDKWSALLECVGGSDDDAIRALSGRFAGRLLLDAEIASKSFYAESERARVRAFETLRAEIIARFETRRRGGLMIKGYTATSPAKPVRISPYLALEYDFAKGAAQSGDIRFHGITVSIRTEEPTKDRAPSSYAGVADAELEDFCQRYLASASPVPSMDALWEAAKQEFIGKHVGRDRVRKMHRALIPPPSRKSGPRK